MLLGRLPNTANYYIYNRTQNNKIMFFNFLLFALLSQKFELTHDQQNKEIAYGKENRITRMPLQTRRQMVLEGATARRATL